MMFIDLNNLKIECTTCGVLTPVRQVRHWHEATWVVSFACESCEEKQTEQENKAIEDNYEDFVKNEDFEPEFCDFCTDPSRCCCSHNRQDDRTIEKVVLNQVYGKNRGRPLGAKDSAPRAICRCSRCGARGRRISSLRGGRCVECEFLEVV